MAYNRNAAVAYAKKWAMSTNSSYPRFDNDCTNFVSQVLLAGGWSMVGERSFWTRKSNDVWWYGGANFTRASYTWAGAQNFHNFMAASKRGSKVSDPMKLQLGDIVQIKNGSGHVYHTMAVTEKDASDLLLSYHTGDHLDEPLSAIKGRLETTDEFIYWKVSDANTSGGGSTQETTKETHGSKSKKKKKN